MGGARHSCTMRTNSTYATVKLAERRFFYGDVEDGLAAALDINDAWRTLFRSRIKHFQRLGVVGERSGRGAPIRYSFEQAARLAIVLMIADVGLDPILSVQLINDRWKSKLRGRVWEAVGPGTEDSEKQWFLTLRMEAMRGPWAKRSPVAAIGMFQRIHRRPPLSEKHREDLKAQFPDEKQFDAQVALLRAPRENIDMWLEHPEQGNFCVFPLSYVLHRLRSHLERIGPGDK